MQHATYHPLPLHYEPILERALAEDIGSGDITSEITIPQSQMARATILAKADGVLAGIAIACRTFSLVDHRIVWEPNAA